MTKQILTLLLLAFIVPVNAQAEVKDSFYFMKDDGKFSAEEKDEEAEYIYAQCQANPFQSIYFDCACIAGDFRNKRDAENLIPQGEVLNSVINNPKEECINTTVIAGDTYKSCLQHSKTFRSRSKKNDEYCQCAANRAALGFKKKPNLNLSNIERIKSTSMASCARIYK